MLINIRDKRSSDIKIPKLDLDIFIRKTHIRIILSFLIDENYVLDQENDEVALEINIDRKNLNGDIDISDSLGNFFLKEKAIIDYNYILYLESNLENAINFLIKK